QRQKHQAAEQSFAGKLRAVKGEGGGYSQPERDGYCHGRYEQAVDHRLPDRAVGKQRSIPVEGEVAGGESADARAVERVDNEDSDRQIEKREYDDGMQQEPA